MKRDGRVYDTELHSCVTSRQLQSDGYHLLLGEHLRRHAKTGRRGEKGPVAFCNPEPESVSHVRRAETPSGLTRHGGLVGVRLSLGRSFWGSVWRGFVAAVLPEAWLG